MNYGGFGQKKPAGMSEPLRSGGVGDKANAAPTFSGGALLTAPPQER